MGVFPPFTFFYCSASIRWRWCKPSTSPEDNRDNSDAHFRAVYKREHCLWGCISPFFPPHIIYSPSRRHTCPQNLINRCFTTPKVVIGGGRKHVKRTWNTRQGVPCSKSWLLQNKLVGQYLFKFFKPFPLNLPFEMYSIDIKFLLELLPCPSIKIGGRDFMSLRYCFIS